ncbi:hypothetical protein XU18_1320 [Perkinsela sp. CCAP 1560/4]|nr:hypothetical protein XU18_1320 [Perkinsela sp. CCAP 1560/4]|eukprot:KNH08104.1 hypothetical protein XU18_1320 [Perkinsela sp. CCAP 1560/4]
MTECNCDRTPRSGDMNLSGFTYDNCNMENFTISKHDANEQRIPIDKVLVTCRSEIVICLSFASPFLVSFICLSLCQCNSITSRDGIGICDLSTLTKQHPTEHFPTSETGRIVQITKYFAFVRNCARPLSMFTIACLAYNDGIGRADRSKLWQQTLMELCIFPLTDRENICGSCECPDEVCQWNGVMCDANEEVVQFSWRVKCQTGTRTISFEFFPYSMKTLSLSILTLLEQ